MRTQVHAFLDGGDEPAFTSDFADGGMVGASGSEPASENVLIFIGQTHAKESRSLSDDQIANARWEVVRIDA